MLMKNKKYKETLMDDVNETKYKFKLKKKRFMIFCLLEFFIPCEAYPE